MASYWQPPRPPMRREVSADSHGASRTMQVATKHEAAANSMSSRRPRSNSVSIPTLATLGGPEQPQGDPRRSETIAAPSQSHWSTQSVRGSEPTIVTLQTPLPIPTPYASTRGRSASVSRPPPTSTTTGGGTSSNRPAGRAEIRFYDKNQPYYDFTNFAEWSIRYNDKDYPTGEHLFQSLKFEDDDIVQRVRRQRTPRDAFQLAQKMKHRMRQGWIQDGLRVEAMQTTLMLKFTQHEKLKRMLLATGDSILIEDSPSDGFWGVGPDGQGYNQLGRSLMHVRGLLRQLEPSNFRPRM